MLSCLVTVQGGEDIEEGLGNGNNLPPMEEPDSQETSVDNGEVGMVCWWTLVGC